MHVAATRLIEVIGARTGDIRNRARHWRANAERHARRRRGATAEADQHASGTGAHQVQCRLVGRGASDDHRHIELVNELAPLVHRRGVEDEAAETMVDYAELERARAAALRRADEQAALYRFTDRLYRASDLAEIYEAALEAITSALDCRRASILLFDHEGHMRFVATRGLSERYCAVAEGHSPWQRGTNENTNGLLRQYFPKGTDLSGYTADYLEFVAARLNTRPRKTLDWRTPAEALDELLSHPPQPPAVAVTA